MNAKTSPAGRLAWCLLVWLLPGLAATAVAQRPPALVVVAKVQQRELPTGQTFVGSVVPLRTSVVGSPVEGEVIDFPVNEGDRVDRQTVLAQLRTKQLDEQLAAARAELRIRELAESELKKVLPKQILEAEARMKSTRALLKLAQTRWKRTQSLLARNAISDDEVEAAESVLAAAQQKVIETEAAWSAASVAEQEKYLQARARVLVQQAEVNRLQDDVLRHTIRPPFEGYVTEEHTEVGQWLAKGDPVVTVVEVDPIDIEVPVPEIYFSRLKVGMNAVVIVEALPGRKWEAPVKLIVPQADVRSRSFPVKVRLKNPEDPAGRLKPGMIARVTLPVGKRGEVLLVPKDALILGGRSPTVCVVDPLPKNAKPPPGPPGSKKPDGVARRVPVELGAADRDLIEVRGSLTVGQQVVVEGNERLATGDFVVVMGRYQSPSKTSAAGSSK